jgi:hypothetical protein
MIWHRSQREPKSNTQRKWKSECKMREHVVSKMASASISCVASRSKATLSHLDLPATVVKRSRQPCPKMLCSNGCELRVPHPFRKRSLHERVMMVDVAVNPSLHALGNAEANIALDVFFFSGYEGGWPPNCGSVSRAHIFLSRNGPRR